MVSHLKKEILKECHRQGISLVGFSQLGRWENPPEELINLKIGFPLNSGHKISTPQNTVLRVRFTSIFTTENRIR